MTKHQFNRLALGGMSLFICALLTPSWAAEDSVELGTMSVVGQGETRAAATIDMQDVASAPPGRTPERLLNSLPGINVQTSDPFGLYEFGTTIRMRGFTTEQLAVTLDGIPMETADLREGSPPHRYVDSENLLSISVAQGSGDVSAPSYHALGGAIHYFTDDPNPQLSAVASQTIGADELERTFLRFDTGQLGANGPSLYLTGSRTRAVQWANDFASLERDHVDVKLQQLIGPHVLKAAFRYNKRDDHDFPLWLANGKRAPFFDLHEDVTGDPEFDALHYDRWANGREDRLFSLHGTFQLSDSLELRVIPYYEDKEGYGWANVSLSAATDLFDDSVGPVTGTPGRTDVALPTGLTARDETMEAERWGLTSGLTWSWGLHEVRTGFWVETSEFHQDRPLFNLTSGGDFDKSSLPVHVYYDRDFDTDVLQFYLTDTLSLMDGRLRLAAGAKGLDFERDFSGIANSDAFNHQRRERFTVKYDDSFQPQVGGVFKLTPTEELFVNYAENFSAPPSLAMVAVNFNPNLEPEESTNIDVGVRTSRGRFDAALAFYYIDYKNRILELTTFDPFRVGSNIFENVGDIETKGAELAFAWRPNSRWRWGSSLTYNDSKFQDDYLADDGSGGLRLVPVAGEQVPDTPKWMLQTGISYFHNEYFASLDAKYTGKRYSATTGIEDVDSYQLLDLSLGYQGGPSGPLANLRIQVNIHNLLDEDYLAVINEGETMGTFIKGAPRSAYLTVRGDF